MEAQDCTNVTGESKSALVPIVICHPLILCVHFMCGVRPYAKEILQYIAWWVFSNTLVGLTHLQCAFEEFTLNAHWVSCTGNAHPARALLEKCVYDYSTVAPTNVCISAPGATCNHRVSMLVTKYQVSVSVSQSQISSVCSAKVWLWLLVEAL